MPPLSRKLPFSTFRRDKHGCVKIWEYYYRCGLAQMWKGGVAHLGLGRSVLPLKNLSLNAPNLHLRQYLGTLRPLPCLLRALPAGRDKDVSAIAAKLAHKTLQ